MNLFDKIPENLFSILASKNKGIYLDALFVVKESFSFELSITRGELLSLLISKIESRIYAIDTNEESENTPGEMDISGKANFLIRKLTETKWLNIEFRGADFESIITLPDYSKKILDVLYDLMHEKSIEYNGLVVSTYNNLVSTDRERGEYAYQALNRVLIDTTSLIDMLKSLYHNIGRYHQMALTLTTVNDILESHFDDFHNAIVTKFLHPFKTFDSVPRFKGPIMTILNKWYNEESMLKILSDQALKYKAAPSEVEAQSLIIQMISDILRHYDQLPELMHEIDMRNNAYTRASIEKIQYLLNRDQSIKGKLVTLINLVSSEAEESKAILEGLNVFRQSYLDSDSLYTRSKMTKSRVIKSDPVKYVAHETIHTEAEAFKGKIKASYGRAAVIEEVMAFLESGRCQSQDLPLEDSRDLSRLMLASIYGMQSTTPFTTEFLQGRYESPKFNVPIIEFSKKG